MKRNFVSNMARRIRKLVSEEYRKDDESIFVQALLENGYPKSFLDKYMAPTDESLTTESDTTKPAILRMQFRGDAAAELLCKKVKRSLEVNCHNIRLIPVFTSRLMVSTHVKDRFSDMATPNVVYKFTCTCGMQYIGLTERRLQDRVREHLPRWLTGTLDGIARSSITEHVLETGHSCRPDSCFEILHRVRSRRMLKFMEAVSIRVNRPCLNVQKIHDFRLKLAWN